MAHIGTSLVDHTGFNGGLVGFGVLSEVCFFERRGFFVTPFRDGAQRLVSQILALRSLDKQVQAIIIIRGYYSV